jgi:hypothetical protein
MGPHVARRCTRGRRAAIFCLHGQAALERRWMDDSNWSSPVAGRIRGRWMGFVGSYDGTLRALPLGEADRAAPVVSSNRWFWLSFPLVLIPFLALAVGLTGRERRRQRVRITPARL